MMYKEFCEELRLQFIRHNNAVESLEKKAKDLITVSGLIATLLMGFGKFIFEGELDLGNLPILPVFLFVVTMILLISTVGISFWANRVEFQRNPFIASLLIENGKLKLNVYESWTEANEKKFYKALSEEYALCLQQAETVIRKKAFRITISSITFPIALGLIPVIMFTAKLELFVEVFSSIIGYL